MPEREGRGILTERKTVPFHVAIHAPGTTARLHTQASQGNSASPSKELEHWRGSAALFYLSSGLLEAGERPAGPIWPSHHWDLDHLGLCRRGSKAKWNL